MFKSNRSNGQNSEESNKNIQSDFIKYAGNVKKDEFIENLAQDNRFVAEEIKMRKMVEDMLEKEFGKNIKNIKSYDYLAESVINRLKNQQLSSM